MPKSAQVMLEPRKLPVQARSAASVDAILEATIQVLLEVGKERLTTARVALRAGVSVGTLYQYFPNKSALLQAVLKQHLDGVTRAVERICLEQRGGTLAQMASALISGFLQAKLGDAKASAALYAVAADVDGTSIAARMALQCHRAVAEMFRTAREPLQRDPQLIASVLQAAMAGVSRELLEGEAPERRLEVFRRELIALACAYLAASSAPDAAGAQTPAGAHRDGLAE